MLTIFMLTRLLVNLTQPAVLCFNNHIPEDKTLRNHYIEIESQLQSYKEVRMAIINSITKNIFRFKKIFFILIHNYFLAIISQVFVDEELFGVLTRKMGDLLKLVLFDNLIS